MARVMSDAEIRRRKKLQGHISQTTSTLGLAGLGVTGAAALAARKPGALKAVQRIPKLGGATPEKMERAAIKTGLVSGGIGGVGGFNFASYTGAESRKRKPAMPVSKSAGVEAPMTGEVGKAKDWQPSASKFDAEKARMKRSQAYEDVGGPAAGALGAAAGYKGAKAGRLLLTNRKVKFSPAKNLPNVQGKMAVRTAEAIKHGKTAAVLGGAAAATGAATLAVRNRNRSRSWAPYSKRSAFGVEHDPVSKAINIKPENRGKFTASAKKAKEGVQEHAHAVVASSKSSELQRKRAQFAINAKKWKH